jgi:class 3 adenylate cyclase
MSHRFKLFLKSALFITGFFLFHPIQSQDFYENVDSLEQEYVKGNYAKDKELIILKNLSSRLNDPQKILKYSDELISKAKAQDSLNYVFSGMLQKGNAYRLKGDNSKALEFYFEAASLAEASNDKTGVAMSKITIGDVYSELGNHKNSIIYYENGIKDLRALKKNIKDSTYLATALLNAGDEYFNEGKYDKAMSYFFESSSICKKTGNNICSAYNLGNIGMVYAKQNKPEFAEDNINEAINILEQEKDYYPISVYLNYISDIYIENDKTDLALSYAERSLNLAKKYRLKDEISQANYQLSKIYEQTKNPEKALYHYKNYTQYKDSVSNLESVQKIGNLETEYAVSKKQIELDLAKQKGKNERVIMYSFLGGMVLVSILAFGLFRRNRFINRTKVLIDKEKQRTDELLLNILPLDTAKELKQNGKVIAKKYQKATVLFTDFKDFTLHAESLSPEKLVEIIDMYFSEFDKIIVKYNLEKIKTIGDSYMCAGGLPLQNDNHLVDIANAALEIIKYVDKVKEVHPVNEARFNIRIGMHTGPVVAGVVGKNKFSYDIWGDSVNIASRMESNCEVGKINVSESTYQLLKDVFVFDSRGEIAIKNRGKIKMYYLIDKK